MGLSGASNMSSPEEYEHPPAGPDGGDQAGGERVERRKVRKVRKRRKKSSESSRETLFLKKQEILREMHTDDAVLGVKEQVERLKKARKEELPLEEKWGDANHLRRGNRWVLFAVLGVAVPVIVIFLVVSLTRGTPGASGTMGSGTLLNLDEPVEVVEAYDRNGPLAWFHDHSVEVFGEAQELLAEWNEATQATQLDGVLREAAQALGRMDADSIEAISDYSVGDPRTVSWEYGAVGQLGYMVITGRRMDYSPFRAYFVNTEDGLRLDWEATSAWSEIPIGSLVEAAPVQPVLVRGWVGKQPHFDTLEGPGSSRSWYLVLDATKQEFVWAYAPAGSRLDKQLLDLMSYGRIVEERKDEVRAIVRLTKPKIGFRETEFEIAELVTSDWVLP